MYVCNGIVLLVLVSVAATTVCAIEQNVTELVCAGYGTLSTKLEYLQEQLSKIEYTLTKIRETNDQAQRETTQPNVMLEVHPEPINQKSVLQRNLSDELQATLDQLGRRIQLLATKEDLAWFKIRTETVLQSLSFSSCMEEPLKRTGKYFIQPTANDEPFLGYCGVTSFGGGWLVIQHRYDGSVDFQRNWTDYRNGFGSVDGEFWLGLDRVHRVTSTGSHTLMVELRYNDGSFKYAHYSEFAIGSEAEHYPIAKLGSYAGTAGETLRFHTGQKFSTAERDNDGSASSNCAADAKAAWWYGDCFHSYVNGVYGDAVTEGFRYTRMLIRKN